MIYVASSWRNIMHVGVVAALQAAARMQGEQFTPYDFRNPTEGNTGFHWQQTGMPTYELRKDYEVPTVPFDEYMRGIAHPIAEQGFKHDLEAMQACDTCVLVLPCGRSAHLELGWFVGQGRRAAILGEPEMVPELMYKMVDHIAPSLFDLLGWLGVEDERSIELAPNGKRTHSPNDCPRCLAGNPAVRSELHHTMATGGRSLSTPHPLA